jgi:hypothetical protein
MRYIPESRMFWLAIGGVWRRYWPIEERPFREMALKLALKTKTRWH